MAVSNINAIINKDIHKVWDIVFAVEKYSEWRSDLSKTEIINEKQFIEYTKDGYATTFSITTIEPYKRWEFDMENSNMSGHWIGVFTASHELTPKEQEIWMLFDRVDVAELLARDAFAKGAYMLGAEDREIMLK